MCNFTYACVFIFHQMFFACMAVFLRNYWWVLCEFIENHVWLWLVQYKNFVSHMVAHIIDWRKSQNLALVKNLVPTVHCWRDKLLSLTELYRQHDKDSECALWEFIVYGACHPSPIPIKKIGSFTWAVKASNA